jgi:hypothetical protein
MVMQNTQESPVSIWQAVMLTPLQSQAAAEIWNNKQMIQELSIRGSFGLLLPLLLARAGKHTGCACALAASAWIATITPDLYRSN